MFSKNHSERSDHSLKRKHRGPSEDVLPVKKKKESQEHNTSANIGDETTRLRQRKKPSRIDGTQNQHQSVNELKRRIRDVKRLLNRVDLPADARIVQERALAGYEKDLAEETARRKRSEMIKKYHFVRFLERKSATKELNRLLRKEQGILKADASSKDVADLTSLAKRIHTARVDLNYTIYYPLTEKYVSLFPNKKQKHNESDGQHQSHDDSDHDSSSADADADPGQSQSFINLDATQGSDGKTTNAKPAMWYVVEKCMKDGTLQLLRDGKLRIEDNVDGVAAAGDTNTLSTGAVGNTKKTNKREKKENNTISEQEKDTRSKRTRDFEEPAAAEGGRKMGRSRPKARNGTLHNNARHGGGGGGAGDDAGDSDGGFFEE